MLFWLERWTKSRNQDNIIKVHSNQEMKYIFDRIILIHSRSKGYSEKNEFEARLYLTTLANIWCSKTTISSAKYKLKH